MHMWYCHVLSVFFFHLLLLSPPIPWLMWKTDLSPGPVQKLGMDGMVDADGDKDNVWYSACVCARVCAEPQLLSMQAGSQ